MSYLAERPPGALAMQRAVDADDPRGRQDAARLVQAEVDTASALQQLGPAWRVLHSVPVGPGPATLAHLLIGPGGVFAIHSLPCLATVVEVEDGRARLSSYGCEDAVAEVRQLAQRVRGGWVQRLGRAVDLPPVSPVVCSTDGGGSPAAQPGEAAEVVPLPELVAHLLRLPRRLTTGEVERLAAVSAEPQTWDAPATEELAADLQARYHDLVGSSRGRPVSTDDDTVVVGSVVSSQPPRGPAEGPAVRATSVLMVACGLVSLGTLGLLSPPGLVLGGVTLRHHGGLRWLNAKDANLFLVGLVMTVLPLPLLLLLLTGMGIARVQ